MQPFQIQIMIDQKQSENEEYFNYLGSMITNEARRTREIKFRIVVATAAFDQNSFHKSVVLTFKEETSKVLHLEYSFVRC
jgi:hypothetical protein